MPRLSSDGSGAINIKNKQDINVKLNPSILNTEVETIKREGSTTKKYRFKLVTVRRLTNKNLSQVQQQLENQQKRLESTAIRLGLPVPYPYTPVAKQSDLKQYYGVYIDEDLNKKQTPVYIFESPSNDIKCFITANGEGKEDWSIHLAYVVSKVKNPDDTYTINWRIYTLDNKTEQTPTRIDYLLENSSLPKCFSYNYPISNLNYLGGGCWSAIAIDPEDRIPIYAQAPNNDNYIKVGTVFKALGESRVLSIVGYSCTPTYSFTWCRGQLELNRRSRSFTQTLDRSTTVSTGVITVDRKHGYTLDLCHRPHTNINSINIAKSTFQEYSYGTARYIGNTNITVGSRYQTPDYGTDTARLSIQSYSMDTNCIRATNIDASNVVNKLSYQPPNFLTVLASSYDMSIFIKYHAGSARGSIIHGYELRSGAGERGYQYGDDYKYWWGYGQIVSFNAYGDTNRYLRSKTTGQRSKIGSMYDLGELKISEDYPNALETTWSAMSNPQTGFFGYEEGSLKFKFQYINPPLIGHQGVYYYEIQPPLIGQFLGGSYDKKFTESNSSYSNGISSSFGASTKLNEAQLRQNYTSYAYSQMLGALGGGGLTSLNIGFVNIAGNDGESIVVKSPNEEMKATFRSNPEYFPVGFWDADYIDITYDDYNHGNIIQYDRQGNVVTTITH